MIKKELSFSDLGGIEGPHFKRTLSLGQPAKFRVSQYLPPSIANLTMTQLQQDHGMAPVQFLNQGFRGIRGCMKDICTKEPEEYSPSLEVSLTKQSVPSRGNSLLLEVSLKMYEDLCAMPVFQGWKTQVPVLWVGSAPPNLHYDAWDNLLIQVSGRKRVIVYEAKDTLHIPTNKYVSAVLQQEGIATGKSAQNVPYYETWVEPGDAVAIPCGSLHSVYGSRDSVSVNCFLSGGIRPRFTRYWYSYQIKFGMPARLSGWLSSQTRQRVAQYCGLRGLEDYYQTLLTYPFLRHL